MPLNFVAKAAIQIGLTAASMALTMMRKIEGPRLDDLKVTSGDYGSTLPSIWGTRRVQGMIFWAENLREVKQENKTKGGKYNEYKYYGTWAVALAEHEIAGVRRVWFDTHLVYQQADAGPISAFSWIQRGSLNFDQGVLGFIDSVHDNKTQGMASLYLGTETQEPDERIKATVEAERGEGSCPAYRGTAYLVFKDIPLEKFGNRIPQISVEVVSGVDPQAVSEEFETTLATNLFRTMRFSSDYSKLAWIKEDGFEVWDVAARTQMISGTMGVSAPAGLTMIGVYNDGSLLFPNSDGIGTQDLLKLRPDLAVETVYSNFDLEQIGCTVVADGNGDEHWGTYPFSFYGKFYFDGVEYYNGWRPYHYFADKYGDVWAVGGNPFDDATFSFQRMVSLGEGPSGWLDSFTVTGVAVGDTVRAHHVLTDDDDCFVAWRSGVLYKIDPSDGSAIASGSASGTPLVYAEQAIWENLTPGAPTIWLGDVEYSLLGLNQVRDVNVLASGAGSVYDPISNALISDAAEGID